jgi:NAD(P)-dependent dehydrogenase (short-subunit alcohol dehydrogenase family)
LKQGAPDARVVNVSSMAHKRGALDFNNLDWSKDYSPWAAYGTSKVRREDCEKKQERREEKREETKT